MCYEQPRYSKIKIFLLIVVTLMVFIGLALLSLSIFFSQPKEMVELTERAKTVEISNDIGLIEKAAMMYALENGDQLPIDPEPITSEDTADLQVKVYPLNFHGQEDDYSLPLVRNSLDEYGMTKDITVYHLETGHNLEATMNSMVQ